MRPDLARCYGEERLPRYTSYPTAPHFSTAVGASIYARWLESVPSGACASLYLHVPFCRRMCWYCGCNTSVARNDQGIVAYTSALRDEIAWVSRQLCHRLRVEHIHFGGGTPTVLDPKAFADLVALLRRLFYVTEESEVAVEVDPRALTASMVGALADSGVTRASIGVQTFDPVVQKAINRVQSYDATAATTDVLRRAGINAINFDLIYGLPHQSVASCIDTVLRCLELAPERFSIFGYAHVPSFKPHQRRIALAALPDGAERHRQFEAMTEILVDCGYRRIGLDHFCKAHDSMSHAQQDGRLRRNFQGYTTDTADVLLGFGASAIGRLDQGYVQNEVGARAYAEKLAAGTLATARGYALTDDDRMRGEIIERIMCDFAVDIERICVRYNRPPRALLGSSARIKDLLASRVVTLEGTRLKVSDDAHFLVRSVAAAFDAHLDGSGSPHSRAV